ncbi:MAG: glycosyltransferase, partial [Bacteroidetes bacterium]|nr:glycosyltransferase [Bacteroidota bacterium]
MDHLRISIITPSYQQAQYLEDAILSVRSQGYPNIEHIVMDGGSDDGSVEILEKHGDQLTYWESEKDEGQTHAINKGLQRATGDIVTWLNSDDVMLPGTLEIVDHYFHENDAALIHGRTILFGDIKQEIEKGAEADGLNHKYLAYIPYPQPSSFFKRSILDEIGYLDEELHYGMD